MHVDAEFVAEHAERVANSPLAVEREAGRQRMQGRVLVRERLLRGGDQHPAQVGRVDLVAAEIDRGGIDVAAQATGGDVDDERVDRHAGHALRRIDGEPHRALHGIEIDDDAALDAARLLVADADDLDAMGAPGEQLAALMRSELADHADDLRGADVEHRDGARPLERKRPQTRQTERRGAKETHACLPTFAAFHASCSAFFSALSRALISASRRSAACCVSCTVMRSAQAKVDRDDLARKDRALAIHDAQVLERLRDMRMRKLDGDAIVENEVPAPVGHAHDRPHALLQGRPAGQDAVEARRPPSPRRARHRAEAPENLLPCTNGTITLPSRSMSDSSRPCCQIAKALRSLSFTSTASG